MKSSNPRHSFATAPGVVEAPIGGGAPAEVDTPAESPRTETAGGGTPPSDTTPNTTSSSPNHRGRNAAIGGGAGLAALGLGTVLLLNPFGAQSGNSITTDDTTGNNQGGTGTEHVDEVDIRTMPYNVYLETISDDERARLSDMLIAESNNLQFELDWWMQATGNPLDAYPKSISPESNPQSFVAYVVFKMRGAYMVNGQPPVYADLKVLGGVYSAEGRQGNPNYSVSESELTNQGAASSADLMRLSSMPEAVSATQIQDLGNGRYSIDITTRNADGQDTTNRYYLDSYEVSAEDPDAVDSTDPANVPGVSQPTTQRVWYVMMGERIS